MNKHKNYTELFVYNENPYDYCKGAKTENYDENGEKVKNGNKRNLRVVDGEIEQLREFEFSKLQYTIKKSSERAKDFFIGYGNNNKFKYFLTTTMDSKKVDRYNDEEVKYVWQLFRQQLQYISHNVKILCVAERHEKADSKGNHALHFHSLIGDIDLEKYFSAAVNYKTYELMFCSEGLQIYNLTLFRFGNNTIVRFPTDYNNERVINYCMKYITKAFCKNILENYNKRYYFRTLNLDNKEKTMKNVSDENIKKIEKAVNSNMLDPMFGKVKKFEKQKGISYRFYDN